MTTSNTSPIDVDDYITVKVGSKRKVLSEPSKKPCDYGYESGLDEREKKKFDENVRIMEEAYSTLFPLVVDSLRKRVEENINEKTTLISKYKGILKDASEIVAKLKDCGCEGHPLDDAHFSITEFVSLIDKDFVLPSSLQLLASIPRLYGNYPF